jgi:hypothetical protein
MTLNLPDWMPAAPTLPEPHGNVRRIASVEAFVDAVASAKPGETILLADGRYFLPRYVELGADSVTLRSESGARDRVVLDGARSAHGELIGMRRCSGITIADITIQNVQWNGIKINSDSNVQRVTIRNCVLRNIWQRAVKGVRVPLDRLDEMRPRDCRIQYCLFVNERPKRYEDDDRDTPENFGGNYVGGIDVMFPKNWVISDNAFVGIQGRTRQGRGAVFLWHQAEDCVVERNVILDCDTGIAFGNSYLPDELRVHAVRCIARNNVVARTPESNIVADYTEDCAILHNTIHDPGNRAGRLIRLVHANDRLRVENNLLDGPPPRVETESAVTMRGNAIGDYATAFVEPSRGDLRLRERVVGVCRAVPRLDDVREDRDGRPRSPQTDAGAYELPGA